MSFGKIKMVKFVLFVKSGTFVFGKISDYTVIEIKAHHASSSGCKCLVIVTMVTANISRG